MPYTVLRYPNVYGPRQDPYGEAGVVAIFARMMLQGEQPVINGDGNQERDFVYVGDIARANLMALDANCDGIYNLGSGHGTSINALFEKLGKIANFTAGAKYGPAKLGEISKTYIDATKARRDLNWEPTISLEDGLQKTVEYFKKHLTVQ